MADAATLLRLLIALDRNASGWHVNDSFFVGRVRLGDFQVNETLRFEEFPSEQFSCIARNEINKRQTNDQTRSHCSNKVLINF